MRCVRPSADMKVGRVRNPGCVEICAHWKHWPCLFPQHGPGRKHQRKIELYPWQVTIVERHPDRLLRGLIHSDGYRGPNYVNGKGYPRYQFSNRSQDIRDIFCGACDLYGVRWRQMNRWVISIARAPDVAKLDRVIGPKS
ncbi:MAG TPA: helix-turn-helix domain-containing protein, partial [Actinomycetota bacterium]|nr:helix-turn-helix domain-containing protein [Actinomycetota bacterium]